MADKKTYVNNGGLHTLEDGTEVKRGQTFESSDPGILAKFPNKFALAGNDVPPVNADSDKGGKDTTKTDDSGKGGNDGDDADDVTRDFKVGKDSGLTVLKENDKWNIYEEGDDDRLNDKPLSKKKVQAFIDDYLED